MPFYKCQKIKTTSVNSYQVYEELLFAKSKSELLNKHDNIVSISRCQEHQADVKTFLLRFFSMIHRLVANGYNTVQALTIASNCFDKIEKLIIQTILNTIKQGFSFSDALKQFGGYFDNTITETLRVSELTGRLPEAIKNIIEYINYRTQFNTKIKNAVSYPVFVLALIFVISLIWIIFIIPQFSKIFKDLEIPIPTVTKCLLTFSSFIKTHYMIVLIILTAILLICKLLKINLPVISSFKSKIIKLQFFEAMALMLRENVNLLDAIKCITKYPEFSQYSRLEDLIKDGCSFALASERLKLFSPQEVSIISVSEQTGQYWVAFSTFADITKLQVENCIRNITKRLPSVLICIVGGLLVLFIYGTFLPLYSSIDVVSNAHL